MIWLGFVVLVLLGAHLGWMEPPLLLVFYFWIMLLSSAVALAAFWLDKLLAQREKRRISERALLFAAIAAGWPGALIGQRAFRHKTQKMSFRVRLWTVVAAHAVFISFLMFVWLF